jgi:hypothetical protein
MFDDILDGLFEEKKNENQITFDFDEINSEEEDAWHNDNIWVSKPGDFIWTN